MADGVDWEEEYEGDDSSLPAQMRAALKPLAQAFLAMAEEETNEALHGQLNDDAALELAAGNEGLAKRGAKHSAATKAHFDGMRAAHKAMGEHLDALQAEPDGDEDGGDAEKLAKAAGELQKVTAERDDALAKLTEIAKQHAAWLTQRADPKGAAKVVVVEKTLSTDTGGNADADDSPVLKADGTVDHEATAAKLMKVAYRKPMTAR